MWTLLNPFYVRVCGICGQPFYPSKVQLKFQIATGNAIYTILGVGENQIPYTGSHNTTSIVEAVYYCVVFQSDSDSC